MAAVKGRGNVSTELRAILLFKANCINGWRRGSRLPGRPDFVFAKQRVAVFVDGDFWHGHPTRFRVPKTRTDFWLKKIQTNRSRDLRVARILRKMGWLVIRIWESRLKEDPDGVGRRIQRALVVENINDGRARTGANADATSRNFGEAFCSSERYRRDDSRGPSPSLIRKE
jgi:DNA mismatch endonuclease (patch repair protein)